MKHDLSRRQLLKSSATLLLPSSGAEMPILAYAGTYSSHEGPESSRGNGKGIYLFRKDPSTGALGKPQLFQDGSNPSWLAVHPSGNYLYAANEISSSNEGDSGTVTAYGIEKPSGHLTRLNTVSSQGAGPAHLSIHPSGRYAFVANYHGGTFAVIPVHADGRLADASDVKSDSGSVGPLHAVSAPVGSFAVSGHDRPHAHMIEADPAGKFVIGTDLGQDQIHVWQFDAGTGKLNSRRGPNGAVPGGDGPRHFVFHPNGRWLYSLQEEGSTLILFNYDADTGALAQKQQLSSLPPGFAGTNFTSEVRISADGNFLYAGNRLHDSIACFSIGPSGRLVFIGETWTRGDYPRSFTIDPTGEFLYSCNQRSDAITTFRINRTTGDLMFTGHYTPIGTPSILIFVK
jgi:6-phosphogluconolactonase